MARSCKLISIRDIYRILLIFANYICFHQIRRRWKRYLRIPRECLRSETLPQHWYAIIRFRSLVVWLSPFLFSFVWVTLFFMRHSPDVSVMEFWVSDFESKYVSWEILLWARACFGVDLSKWVGLKRCFFRLQHLEWFYVYGEWRVLWTRKLMGRWLRDRVCVKFDCMNDTYTQSGRGGLIISLYTNTRGGRWFDEWSWTK